MSLCRRCGSSKFAEFEKLSEDEKFIAERTASDSDLRGDKIKEHRFCKRCLFPQFIEAGNRV